MWARLRPSRPPHLEGMMKDDRTVKAREEQPAGAEGTPETQLPERRPFAPPAVQELGALKDLTQVLISG